MRILSEKSVIIHYINVIFIIFIYFLILKLVRVSTSPDVRKMTIIVCLVGTHLGRPFEGIRHWSKRQGITRLYLLYSDVETEDETAIFSYMSRKNAEELRERLEILEPIMVGYDPMDHRSAFRTIYGVLSRAAEEGEEALIDITSTTNLTQGVALTVALMFRNARVYTVPSEQPAWYVEGKVGDERFEEWFEKARNQPGLEPIEIKLPGYRLEPHTKHEEREWEMERQLLRLLRERGGSADSVSDLIRWFGHEDPSSTLRNRFSRIVSRLEARGLIESEKGSKMKSIQLTEFGSIYAEAISEESDV